MLKEEANMLETQKYLQAYGLEQLQSELGIKAKRHPQFPELVLLKYDQIDSPKLHPVVRECRGLILNSSDWSVVSRPLDRFFNLGEHGSAELDADSTVAYEKLDGSLCCLYYWADDWHVQTSGTPDASGRVNDSGMAFKELFWRTWFTELDYQLPFSQHNLTFVFELTGPANQIVVQYDKPSISLLAVRNRETGAEHDSEAVAKAYGWQHAKRFDGELDMTVSAGKREGYVLVDRHRNRVKVKTEQYVAMHRSASGMSDEDAMLIVMSGEVDETVAYFPKYRDKLESLSQSWQLLQCLVSEQWALLGHLRQDRRAFALAIKDLPYKQCLFSLADGKDWKQQCLRNPKRALGLVESLANKPSSQKLLWY